MERDIFPNTMITSSNFIDCLRKQDEPDHQSQTDDTKVDDDFDTYVLKNFIPFSGKQNVTQWLDETERKFNESHISRSLRFQAISLLIEGEAKRAYLKHRKEIRSFDDFYEFLLSFFDNASTESHNSNYNQNIANHRSNFSTSVKTKSVDKSTSTILNINDNISFTNHPPIFSSTANVDLGATHIVGAISAATSIKHHG